MNSNFRQASTLLESFKNPSEKLFSYLTSIYGDDSDLIDRKIEKYSCVLEKYIEKYGDNKVIISRAPGRINLMGRHIEHRGGNINPIAIHKETLMVASLRDDDKITISNTNSAFSDFTFSISEEMSLAGSTNWLDYIESPNVIDQVQKNKGHWVNYVKSAVLRFHLESASPFKGMDIMCLGTVPIAGGVSSSSSIVMATAELVCEINNLSFELPTFIGLCGQSEWYVGSRGGAGDHAAIKCGSLDSISPIEFEPINLLSPIKIPTEYSIIVADSFIKAKKSEGAKDRFNQMVAAYEFGVMLIKKNFPQFKDKIIHLRDINPKTLGVSEKEIYEMLLSLPLFIAPDELYEQIPEEYHEKVRRITNSHAPPEKYNLRSAVYFGITECERSRICSKILAEGKIADFAKLMNISHNGDRVAITQGTEVADYDYYITDAKLKTLIKLAEENNENAQLYKQPGGYACSTKEIDVLVDKVLLQKGVLGAQISGAGLGGCIMILCKSSSASDILDFLQSEYYKPNGYPNGAIIVKPIMGSMCLKFE